MMQIGFSRVTGAVLGIALFCGLAWAQTAPAAGQHQTVVFMTDFGHVDDSVAICKGVMLGDRR